MQAERKSVADVPSSSVRPIQVHGSASDSSGPDHRRKRRGSNRPEDEIDAVFKANLGKRIKKGHIDVIAGEDDRQSHSIIRSIKDPGLQDVLGAIRAAPKGERERKRI
jgi:nucleolar protein 9